MLKFLYHLFHHYQLLVSISLYIISFIDIPFIDGSFKPANDTFNSLHTKNINIDDSIQYLYIIQHLESSILRDLILFIIPDYIPPLPVNITPLCGSGIVNVIISRNTTTHASSESFTIRNSAGRLIFTQPEVEDNQQYTWNVDMNVNDGYAIRLTDSSKKGWSDGSIVSISTSSFFYGSFHLSGSSRSIQSFYSIPSLNIIDYDDDCTKLSLNCWGSITLAPNACSSFSTPLNITNYPYLRSIHFGEDVLYELPSLTISNNLQLSRIDIVSATSCSIMCNTESFHIESISLTIPV